MEKEILISIIVPIYNVEKYLNRCLNSICNQSYRNLEIILIDDGSTDKSGFICDKWEKIDDRILVMHQSNSGVSEARNNGLKIAAGDYIGFVDPDDFIDKYMFEKMIYEANIGDYDIVCCNNYNYFDNGTMIVNIKNMKKNIFTFKEYILFCLEKGGTVWNRIYKKKILKSQYFEKDIYVLEDLLFNIKLASNCNKIFFLDEALYYYYINNNSVLRKKTTKQNMYKRESSLFAKEKIIQVADKYKLNNINQLKLEFVYHNERLKKIYKCNNEKLESISKKFIKSGILLKNNNIFLKIKTILILYFPKLYLFLKKED